jgi:hypothetical protein
LKIFLNKYKKSILPVYVGIDSVCQAFIQETILARLHGIVLLKRESPASVCIEGLIYAYLGAALEGLTTGRVEVLEDFPKIKTLILFIIGMY